MQPILNHKIYGTGDKKIYIIHGIFGMLDNWHYHAQLLGKEHTVVTMDVRNHGKSFWNNSMHFNEMADDIFNLMQFLNHEKIILFGHSMGGKIAMQFAKQFPGLLEKLCIIDIAPKAYRAGHLPYFEALRNLPFHTYQNRTEAETAFLPYAPELGVRQFLLKNLEALPNGGYKPKLNVEVIYQFYNEIIGELQLNKPTFLGKTFIIAGEKSGYIKSEDIYLMKEYFPNAAIIQISNAGHWVHADNPQEFLKVSQQIIDS